MKTIFRFVFVALFLAGLLTVQAVKPAYAAGIIVNTNADNTTIDGSCTLREAITNANNDAATYPDCTSGSGNDVITFAGNYTITLGSSLPDVTDIDGLTITGNGTSNTIIQAAASAGTATYRIIKVNGSSVSATMEYMTLRYGVEASGGAINIASANLTLNYVTISDNQVNNSVSTGLNGGAISINSGTLTINNSTLSNNSVTTNDTSSNVRGSGGAIYAGGGTVTLNNTTVSGNLAIRGGGGLFTNGATININYSTIANNTSNNADGIAYSSLDGGGINRNAGTINLKSSIVAGNKKGVSSSTDNDCAGTINSLGYNLTGSGTGCSFAGTGDVTVTPSTVFTNVLGSLSDNGGSTYTHALIVSGAAVNAIPSGTNSCGTTPFDYDQRGGVRPYNSNCDIGAYELKTVHGVSTTGTDSGDCTVTDCASIVYAYGKAQSGDTISVAVGTYTETSEFDITKSITINGAGAMSTFVQAAASPGIATHRFYKIIGSAVTANIQNLTLRYGVQASGGAINIASGTLNLTNVILSDNQVNNALGTGLNGGAISLNGGTVNITNSAIINNSVTTNDTSSNVRGSGGGLFIGSGTANLNNVTVSGNSAIRGGGGLFANGGTLNVNYSTIANNTSNNADGPAYSSLDGGGINRNAGTINLKSSIVAGNKKGVSSSTDNDCNGTITSQGYNLTGSGTSCSLSGTGDVTVTPSTVFTSVLGSLANNGGNTFTHLLYGGNAAQDAIPNGTNSCGSGSFTQDQRGSTRPYNNNCDMGAYESQDAAPTVSLSTTASDPTNISPIPVTVTFSESVTGFTSGDITPGNATVNNFTGSGANYSFDLIPSGDGSVTADIAAGVAQDSVYNYNTGANQLNRVYDATPPAAPTISVPANSSSTNDATPTITGSAEANSTVSVYIDNILSSTVTADNSGNWNYTPVSSLVEGTHTVKAYATDATGNTSSASATNIFNVDTTVPTNQNDVFASSTTKQGGASVTIVSSGDSNNNVWFAPSGTTNFSAGATMTTAGGTATSILAPATAGEYKLFVIDAAGNVSSASTATLTIDNTAPTAAITYSPTGLYKSGTSVTITATFNEAMLDAPIPQISISGSDTLAATDMTKASATVYTYSYTAGAGNGTATIAISTGTDVAGNAVTAAPASGATFILDNTAPTNQDTVFATSASKTGGASVTIVSSGDATNNVWFAPSGTTTFATGSTMTTAAGDATSILTPATEGTYKLYVIDAVGNASGASTATLTVDNTPPSGTTISIKPATYVTSTTASFTFSATDNVTAAGSLIFKCRLDADPYATCFSPKVFSGLSVAKHTFSVYAVDQAGNQRVTPTTYSWTIQKERALNGGFNIYPTTGNTKIPTYWAPVNFVTTSGDGKDTTVKYGATGAAVKIIGNGKTKTLTQTFSLNGVKGNKFTFTYYAKGTSFPTTGLCKAEVFLYSGGTWKLVKLLSCTNSATFQKYTGTFYSTVAYTKVKIVFTYSKASGTVWFDAVSLSR